MIFTKFGQYVGQGEYNYKAPASHVPTIWGQCCRQRDNQLGLRLLMATGVNSISIDLLESTTENTYIRKQSTSFTHTN